MDESKVNFKQQLLAFLICAITFSLVYNLNALYAASLSDVRSCVFDFEEKIPFIALTVLPYMTSGLFFLLVFFVTKRKEDLIVLTKRILFITIISGICFLFFPLRFTFDRPIVESSFLNIFFDYLNTYDNRFNQAPSLHVSYACIFWSVFKSKTNGFFKILLGFWIFMIGLSTLTIYQHHIIDVTTALMLVCITFFIFPQPIRRNCRIGMIYFFVALELVMILMFFYHLSIILNVVVLWIIVTLAIVGYAYFTSNPYFLKKKRGKVNPLMHLLCFPYVEVNKLMRRYFRKKGIPVFTEIYPQVYVGARLDKESMMKMKKIASKVILIDLMAEVSEYREARQEFDYYSYPLLDIASAKDVEIEEIVRFITKKYIDLSLDTIIYIHCILGYSRSVYIGSLFLKQQLNLSIEDASRSVIEKMPYAIYPYYMNKK